MTRTKKLLGVLALLVVGGVALAASPTKFLDVDIKNRLFVGTSAIATSTNAMTESVACRIDYTFPASPDDGGTTGVATQISGWGCTATGAAVGDPCFTGIGYGSSGVPANDLDSDHFDCFVSAANTLKVRRHSMRGAGARVDAGFSLRAISNQ